MFYRILIGAAEHLSFFFSTPRARLQWPAFFGRKLRHCRLVFCGAVAKFGEQISSILPKAFCTIIERRFPTFWLAHFCFRGQTHNLRVCKWIDCSTRISLLIPFACRGHPWPYRQIFSSVQFISGGSGEIICLIPHGSAHFTSGTA